MRTRPFSGTKGIAALLTLGLCLGLGAPSLAAADGRQGTIEFFYGNYAISESPAPIGTLFEQIYGKAGTILGLKLSSALVWNFDFYLELKGLRKTGKLTYTEEKTTLLLIPISLGLRYVQPLGFIQPYIGGGVDFYVFYEDNPIGSVFNYVNGTHFLGGIYLRIDKSVPVLLNLQIKYTSATSNINDRKVELGGLEYGASFVLAF